MTPRRPSYWACQLVIDVVSVGVLLRYGLVPFVGMVAVDMLAFKQGLDRGGDIAKAVWRRGW